MATTAAEQLQQILDDVARTGALTATAIKQFDDYRKRVEELEKVNATHEKWRYETGRELDKLRSDLSHRSQQVEAQGKELEKLRAESAAAQKAIWVAGFEAERRQEMRSILSDVFRNVELNRTIARNIVVPATPPTPSNSYGSPAYTTPVTDTETTREG